MSKVFDSYAAYYDLLYRDKNYKAEVVYICRLLKKYKIDSGTILELGSGTGNGKGLDFQNDPSYKQYSIGVKLTF